MPGQEAILKRVGAVFEHEPRITLPRYPVHLAFADAILMLAGEVEPIVVKTLRVKLAAAVPGVDRLVDRLRVLPTLPMDNGAVHSAFPSTVPFMS